MVTIRKAKLKDYSTLMDLSINDEQKPFVSSFEELYQNRTPEHEFYVINDGKTLLGFFVLDRAYAKRYTFCESNALGVRNLVIGKEYQGNGYATDALKRLIDYAYMAYPTASSLYLTVNKKNLAAYRCYEKAGFNDTGEVYRGGEAGPQHIMAKRLG